MTIALNKIPGIGPSTAKGLIENGFKSANEIAQATIAQLIGVPGFSTARASRTIKAANELLSASDDATHSTTQPAPRQQQTANRPAPKSPSGTTVDNDTKETEIVEITKKEQEELQKEEKAAAKSAKKAKKAAAKKAKKAEKAEKAAAKKVKKAEKAEKAAAKKAEKDAAKKAKKTKKAAAKKAKAGAKKSRK